MMTGILKRKFSEVDGSSPCSLLRELDDVVSGSDSGNSSDSLNPSTSCTPSSILKREKRVCVRSEKRVCVRSVSFEGGVTVYYFSRRQGFSSVPTQGGSTLGMSTRHSWVRRFTLGEFASEQERSHRDMLREHLCQERLRQLTQRGLVGSEQAACLMPADVPEEEVDAESAEVDEYFFLQPLSTRKRRALLRSSGVRRIVAGEKHELRAIRVSREECGCDCAVYCDPATCACSHAGIKCQVDRSAFPCGCSREGCANASGRVEFNPARVRSHLLHTLSRLQLERSRDTAATTTTTPHRHHGNGYLGDRAVGVQSQLGGGGGLEFALTETLPQASIALLHTAHTHTHTDTQQEEDDEEDDDEYDEDDSDDEDDDDDSDSDSDDEDDCDDSSVLSGLSDSSTHSLLDSDLEREEEEEWEEDDKDERMPTAPSVPLSSTVIPLSSALSVSDRSHGSTSPARSDPSASTAGYTDQHSANADQYCTTVTNALSDPSVCYYHLDHCTAANPPSNITDQHNTTSTHTDQYNTMSNITDQYNMTSNITDQHNTTSNKTDQYNTTNNITDQYNTTSNITDQYSTTSNITDQYNTTNNITDQYNTTSNITDQYSTTSNITDQYNTTNNITDQYNMTSNITDQHNTTSNKTDQYNTTNNITDQYSTTNNITDQYNTTNNITDQYNTTNNITDQYNTTFNITDQYNTTSNITDQYCTTLSTNLPSTHTDQHNTPSNITDQLCTTQSANATSTNSDHRHSPTAPPQNHANQYCGRPSLPVDRMDHATIPYSHGSDNLDCYSELYGPTATPQDRTAEPRGQRRTTAQYNAHATFHATSAPCSDYSQSRPQHGHPLTNEEGSSVVSSTPSNEQSNPLSDGVCWDISVEPAPEFQNPLDYNTQAAAGQKGSHVVSEDPQKDLNGLTKVLPSLPDGKQDQRPLENSPEGPLA